MPLVVVNNAEDFYLMIKYMYISSLYITFLDITLCFLFQSHLKNKLSKKLITMILGENKNYSLCTYLFTNFRNFPFYTYMYMYMYTDVEPSNK